MERVFRLEKGTLAYREMGGKVEVYADILNDGRGLYKAWLKGNGGRVELGTLMPEGNRLRLRRVLFAEQLRRAGCWPIAAGGVMLAHSFQKPAALPPGWTVEKNPARHFPEDPVLQRTAAEGKECLHFSRKGGGFLLAVPFGEGRPLGLNPLFCLARVVKLGGRHWAVYRFTPEGQPWRPRR